jgi:hypothetical protein
MANYSAQMRKPRYLDGTSAPLSGPEETELRARLGGQTFIQELDRKGLPLTRENYIKAMFGDDVHEDDWGAEHEDALPRELRR